MTRDEIDECERSECAVTRNKLINRTTKKAK